MADEYLQQLTAETAPASTDIVPITDSGTQRLRSLEYSYIALEDVTGAGDAATAMTVGKLYHTAVTASRAYTLPTTAAVGQRCGVLCKADNAYPVIISPAAGDTVNGGTAGAEWSRLFIAGELVIFRCVVANTAWVVESDGRIPCKAKLTLSADVTTHASGSWILLEFDTISWEVGGCADTTNYRLITRRAGNYYVHAQCRHLTTMSSNEWVKPIVRNSANTAQIYAGDKRSAGLNYSWKAAWCAGLAQDMAADDYLDVEFHSIAANRGVAITDTFFSFYEVL